MKRKPYHLNPSCGIKNTHHVFSQKRYPKLVDNKNNKVLVDKKQHEYFHQLFTDRNPYEILTYIVEEFWGGNIYLVRDFLNNYSKHN